MYTNAYVCSITIGCEFEFNILRQFKMAAMLFYYLFKSFPDDYDRAQYWNDL